MLDQVALRIKVIYHRICVRFVTGSKHHQLKLVCQLLKDLHSVRANVDRRQHRMPSRKSNRDLYLVLLRELLETVNQSLIQIEHYSDFI